MNFYDLIQRLIDETTKVSLPGFMPELVLCATIVAMLLARMPRFGHRIHAVFIALPGTLVARYYAEPWKNLAANPELHDKLLGCQLFDGMLAYDTFTVYIRSILLIFAVLFLVFSWLSGIPDREVSPDMYSLVLVATIGMC